MTSPYRALTGSISASELRSGDRVALFILFIAIGYFVHEAAGLIDAPGLQYDEVLFVNAATGEATNGLFVAKRILGIPVMLMGYVGALKAYLYYPVFRLFGVSAATVRWPLRCRDSDAASRHPQSIAPTCHSTPHGRAR